MRRLFAMVFGSMLGAAAMFVAFKFHVIRTKDDWVFVPKPSAALVDAYVDVREWNASEWTKHPELVKAMMNNGKGDLIRQSVTTNWKDSIKDAIFGEDETESRDSKDSDLSFDFPGLERR